MVQEEGHSVGGGGGREREKSNIVFCLTQNLGLYNVHTHVLV